MAFAQYICGHVTKDEIKCKSMTYRGAVWIILVKIKSWNRLRWYWFRKKQIILSWKKLHVPLALDHMLSPLGGKKQPVPSNLFQFICMDHHCIIYSKTHCDLLSAQTTYLIAVFGGLLERTIFDLLLCMAHISTCIGANLKNYMRSGKDFSRTTI